ncbi:MAG: DNA-formamidopyrimidine glycosylase family protein [Candidatus Brocadiia bacterium]
MPELPDVEAMRRYLEATSLHQKVEGVEVRDDYVLKGVTPPDLREALVGREFRSTVRHGKNMLVELDEPPWLRLHFGMTGNLNYHRGEAPGLEHVRVLLRFSGGYRLAYLCQRKLGRISLPESPEAFVQEQGLGPDALSVDFDDFRRIMDGRRGRLKSALMNQHIIAGLGNVYADEALFQARLHPLRTVDSLSERRLEALHHAMRDVLRTSIARGSDARDLPAGYLLHRRGEGEDCPRCGGTIERVKVNQRSTYFCPRCQPTPD